MRVLFIKLGSIGDVVHTLPSLAAVKDSLPEARVSWVVERGAAEVLHDNPLLDELIVLDTRTLRRAPFTSRGVWSPAAQFARLRADSYDIAIDFQGLFKSALVARLARARRRVGFAKEALREPASRFLLSTTLEVPRRAHVIRRNLALACGALDIPIPDNAEFRFPLAIRNEHERDAAQAIEALGIGVKRNGYRKRGGFAILNPGGGWWTKQWEPERFGRLADALWEQENLRSIVSYGPGEEELAARVVAASRTRAAHKLTLPLRSFFALACQARLYVGGDTGPTHLAVAAGAPVVGLFGPTEWWRNGSPRQEDIVVERTDIHCREDCHRRACTQWVCMDIEVERVYAAARERLRRDEASRAVDEHDRESYSETIISA